MGDLAKRRDDREPCRGPGLHDWAGWIDGDTIITGSEGSSWQPLVGNVIRGGTLHPVAARGFFAALFPTDII